MKCINFNNITKIFKEKTVLNSISFSVEEGEIFGLLGPSGAGKTTIIKILTGQLSSENGEACLWDQACTALSDDTYSKIGMVLDDSGLYVRLTCYENLMIFAELYNVSKDVIPEVLKKVGLFDDMKTQVLKLSKGMKQRLVFARAIMHSPKLLFLDEPTSGLDPATMQEIHHIINSLRDNGTTVFLTTHNMIEATELCDNVALLNEGKIVEYGNPESLCRKYNEKQQLSILLKSGESITLPNKKDSADKIKELIESESIESIHSSEPTLETVFIELTGRKLV